MITRQGFCPQHAADHTVLRFRCMLLQPESSSEEESSEEEEPVQAVKAKANGKKVSIFAA